MILVVVAIVVLICVFVSIVNFNYQKQKYKYSTDDELKRLSIFESPATWRVCIVISLLLLVGTIVVSAKYLIDGSVNLGNQQNNSNQYQGDFSNQNQNDSQIQSTNSQ
ncbi:MAG TPA: hypothetical protein VF941_24560 [Clostridia bacterium]